MQRDLLVAYRLSFPAMEREGTQLTYAHGPGRFVFCRFSLDRMSGRPPGALLFADMALRQCLSFQTSVPFRYYSPSPSNCD